MNKLVTIGENKTAVLLVPEIEGQLAIVHLSTIQRLAAMLPKVKFADIQENMIHTLASTNTLEEYVVVLENELAFHKSINLITEYKPEAPEVEKWA